MAHASFSITRSRGLVFESEGEHREPRENWISRRCQARRERKDYHKIILLPPKEQQRPPPLYNLSARSRACVSPTRYRNNAKITQQSRAYTSIHTIHSKFRKQKTRESCSPSCLCTYIHARTHVRRRRSIALHNERRRKVCPAMQWAQRERASVSMSHP